ncbi:MAG: glycosyltransferase 87 family protein [Stellaceae bacterium]
MRRNLTLGLAACALVMLILVGLGLLAQRHRAIGWFVAVALAQGAVYVAAVALSWRGGGSRRALFLILAAAALFRLPIVLAPPSLSTDIFRYVWDGRVQAAGTNPYRYIPNDAHLANLRDVAIFPNINRNNYARTIYPPVAEAFFLAVARVSASVTGMKVAMVACEAAALYFLLRLLRDRKLPAERILIYAWHPLPLWEFAGSGHVDALVVLLVAAALWGRRHLPQWLVGVALAGAALVKFFPAAVLPALYRRGDWRMPLAFALTIVLAYLPYLGVGWHVLGFLGGYAGEEGFRSGSGFYIWELLGTALPLSGVGPGCYVAAAGVVLVALSAAIVLAPPRDAAIGSAVLALAFTVLVSPHYPWYFAWLVVFLCLLPWLSLFWLTLASVLLYLVPVGSHLVANGDRLLVESAIYAPFAVLAWLDFARREGRAVGSEDR